MAPRTVRVRRATANKPVMELRLAAIAQQIPYMEDRVKKMVRSLCADELKGANPSLSRLLCRLINPLCSLAYPLALALDSHSPFQHEASLTAISRAPRHLALLSPPCPVHPSHPRLSPKLAPKNPAPLPQPPPLSTQEQSPCRSAPPARPRIHRRKVCSAAMRTARRCAAPRRTRRVRAPTCLTARSVCAACCSRPARR